MNHRGSTHWTHRRIAALATSVLMVVALVLAAPVTRADPGDPEFLEVTKSVSSQDLTPGETFTYEIKVQCSQQACVNAQLTDALPAELAGFPIRAFSSTPGETAVPRTITWNVGGTPRPTHRRTSPQTPRSSSTSPAASTMCWPRGTD